MLKAQLLIVRFIGEGDGSGSRELAALNKVTEKCGALVVRKARFYT